MSKELPKCQVCKEVNFNLAYGWKKFLGIYVNGVCLSCLNKLYEIRRKQENIPIPECRRFKTEREREKV